jgi:hypothetical protein
MRKLLLALALCLASTSAWAQCNGTFAPNTFCGNNTSATRPPFQISGVTSVFGPTSSTSGDIVTYGNTFGNSLSDQSTIATSQTLTVSAFTINNSLTYGGVKLLPSVTGTGTLVLATAPTLVQPQFTFGTGSNNITAGSANTGAFNEFVAQNSGTVSNSATEAIVAAALANNATQNIYIAALGGPTPTGYLQCGSGLTGGCVISAGAGNLNLTGPTTFVPTGGGAATKYTCVDASNNVVTQTVPCATPSVAAEFTPVLPTSTTSTTGTMIGYGATCKITPSYASRLEVHFIGNLVNSASTDSSITSLYFGSGSAPTSPSALTGTLVGKGVNYTAAGTPGTGPFTLGGYVTGLTSGTAYWFDLGLAATAGTASLNNINCFMKEF